MTRARKEIPKVRSWSTSETATLLDFVGYKAGMTNVIAMDNRKSSTTAGMEIFIPVTVIETPPVYVVAIRAYRKGYGGKQASAEIWAKDVPAEVSNRVTIPKKREPEAKISVLEKDIEKITDIHLVVCTQPKLISMPKKNPDVLELAVGGSVSEKFEYAKGVLGKEINVDSVFNANTFIDVLGVTKGKGFTGVVKRHGIKIQPRKAGKGRRHIGTGGAWTPSRKLWRYPLPGRKGYHNRTEYNKPVLQVGKDGKDVSPAGGFLHYGPVNNSYVILGGSVPGPAKRLIRLTQPRRASGEVNFEITHVNLASKQGV
jgi:large subunit ribosomal protein L3